MRNFNVRSKKIRNERTEKLIGNITRFDRYVPELLPLFQDFVLINILRTEVPLGYEKERHKKSSAGGGIIKAMWGETSGIMKDKIISF